MRCLLCDQKYEEGRFMDLFEADDPICSSCRKKWIRKPIHFQLQKIPVYASYLYEEAFASCLLQYKECFDEALKDVFLFEIKNQIRLRYLGYTIALMPSSQKRIAERGFHHLEEMFQCLKMPIIDPFIKIDETDQKNLSFSEREKMVDKIQLKDNISLPKKLLLVDDTITSGSTLKGAISCLEKKKIKVKIYCVSANQRWHTSNCTY